MRMIDSGMTSVQIVKQLRNMARQPTSRRWQNSHKETREIDLKKSMDRPKIVQTKGAIQKVKQRLIYKGRRSAKLLAKSFGVSSRTMRRVLKKDFHLRAYRITSQTQLNDDNKKRRISFAHSMGKSLRKKSW